MRTFVAIELPDDLKKKAYDFQKELKKRGILDGNWTKEYHLTLKFLGEIDKTKLKEIEKQLADISAKTKKFELEIRGVSSFPSKDFVRVLWAGVGAGYEDALVLHEKIDDALLPLGFQKEKKYENHITLCRVEKVADKKNLKGIFENKNEFGTFTVSEIKLIESHLTAEGPVYKVLKTFKLA